MDDSFICSLCSYHLPLEKYTLLVLLSFNPVSSTSIRNIEQNDTNLGHLTQVRFDLGFNSPVQNRTISQQI